MEQPGCFTRETPSNATGTEHDAADGEGRSSWGELGFNWSDRRRQRSCNTQLALAEHQPVRVLQRLQLERQAAPGDRATRNWRLPSVSGFGLFSGELRLAATNTGEVGGARRSCNTQLALAEHQPVRDLQRLQLERQAAPGDRATRNWRLPTISEFGLLSGELRLAATNTGEVGGARRSCNTQLALAEPQLVQALQRLQVERQAAPGDRATRTWRLPTISEFGLFSGELRLAATNTGEVGRDGDALALRSDVAEQ
ncbi:uncharacterized protein LOC125947673 [Dermacentor silvarum]|uniref:uncharacterized protein LOC125947673 n=1 Tax=Dermacentor silvarum TaxID=543639 RepID=UPI0021018845|nr:uncharacterized protein LOC125947673 [Dermacentor silvarum]